MTPSLFFKNLLFTLVVPGTVAVYVPLRFFRAAEPVHPGLRFLGIGLVAVGAAVVLWCIWEFGTRGKGTPAPIDAPRRLVVRGLYRYVRNPMYVGVLTVILGWAAFFASGGALVYAVSLAIVFHLVVVLYEERALKSAFGTEYEDYRRRVGRWWPRAIRDATG